MNIWQAKVEEFHEATGSTVGLEPSLRDRELRAKLIMEEAVETVAALGYDVHATIDEVGVPGIRPHKEVSTFHKKYTGGMFEDFIDGLCDLVYVALGSAVAAGIDLDPHFSEVHRANMTKLDGPKRQDGKQLKPEGWKAPDHETIIIRQRERAEEWKRLEEKWSRT